MIRISATSITSDYDLFRSYPSSLFVHVSHNSNTVKTVEIKCWFYVVQTHLRGSHRTQIIHLLASADKEEETANCVGEVLQVHAHATSDTVNQEHRH